MKMIKVLLQNKKVKKSLEERFAIYNGKNLTKDFVWDNAVGKKYGK